MQMVGDRVIVREKRVEDIEDDYEWRSNPDLAVFDGVPALRMSWADYKRIAESDIRHPIPRQLTFSIEDPETGLHIGNCMYYDHDEYRSQAELGIMIGRSEYWSKGYGSDAVTLLLHYLFNEMKLKRVYLHTLKWNERAQKAFKKVGFEPIREVQRNGHIFILMEVVAPTAVEEAPQL